MSKRSNFKRNKRDYYKTPEKAVLPLLAHLIGTGNLIAEPCAGDGQLSDLLRKFGLGVSHESDVKPQTERIQKINALKLVNLYGVADIIVTNPPWEKRIWKGEIFNKLLRHWLKTFVAPKEHPESAGDIWLLFDAGWAHTVQSKEFMPYCKKIVAVGRIKWFPGTKHESLDDCSWYCFNANHKDLGFVPFYGREGSDG